MRVRWILTIRKITRIRSATKKAEQGCLDLIAAMRRTSRRAVEGCWLVAWLTPFRNSTAPMSRIGVISGEGEDVCPKKGFLILSIRSYGTENLVFLSSLKI